MTEAVGMPTLYSSTPEPSVALLTQPASRALGASSPHVLRPFLFPSKHRRRRHSRHPYCLLLLNLGGRRGGPAANRIMAAVYAVGGRHQRHGGARRSPGEADLRLEMLLRRGVPDGGPDRGRCVPVLQ